MRKGVILEKNKLLNILFSFPKILQIYKQKRGICHFTGDKKQLFN